MVEKVEKDSQILKTSKKLSFENENLNQEIRNLRTMFRTHKLIIKKAFGGVRQKHKHVTYYIEIYDKTFHLQLDEFGNYSLLQYSGGEIYSRRFDSVKRMIEECSKYLKSQIK